MKQFVNNTIRGCSLLEHNGELEFGKQGWLDLFGDETSAKKGLIIIEEPWQFRIRISGCLSIIFDRTKMQRFAM
jgi:hypothetical protein